MMPGSVRADERARVSRFAAVLDRDEFRSELDRLCVSEWRWGAPQAVRFQPLKWHLERCTFEIAVKTETGWHSVIGKVYGVERAGVFRMWEAVWQAGFGPGAEFYIPQPLAYLPSMRILLEEKIQGPSAKEILLSGTPHERMAAAERCGRWLARFHTAAPRLGTAVDIRGEFTRFRRWADRVTSFGQPFAAKGARLFQELEAAAPAPDTVEYRAGHGSYIPEHVFLSGSRTAVIDLDEHDVAFPRFGSVPRSCWTRAFGPHDALLGSGSPRDRAGAIRSRRAGTSAAWSTSPSSTADSPRRRWGSEGQPRQPAGDRGHPPPKRDARGAAGAAQPGPGRREHRRRGQGAAAGAR